MKVGTIVQMRENGKGLLFGDLFWRKGEVAIFVDDIGDGSEKLYFPDQNYYWYVLPNDYIIIYEE